MKYKKIIAAAFIAAWTLTPACAEEINPALVFKAAEERDIGLKELLKERQITINSFETADHKKGWELGMGTGETGITFTTGTLSSGAGSITSAPYLRLSLPEETGAIITTEASLSTDTSFQRLRISPSIRYSQDLGKLFGLEKQDTVTTLQRNLDLKNLDHKILLQRKEIEKNVIQNLIQIGEAEKSVITIQTSLYEKSTILDNQVKTGTILQGGSIHLSRVLEIRELEAQINELERTQKNNLDSFYLLTGMRLSGVLAFPARETPVLPENFLKLLTSRRLAEEALQVKMAEHSDLSAPVPPSFSLELGGGFIADETGGPAGSAGFTGKIDGLSLNVKGEYHPEEGTTLSAGVGLTFTDKRLKELERELAGYHIEAAAYRLAATEAEASRQIYQLESDIIKLENAGRNLDVSAAFINQYMDEMKAKNRAGLIPEIEYQKAGDQLKLLQLDYTILNLQRYLLENTISSLTSGRQDLI